MMNSTSTTRAPMSANMGRAKPVSRSSEYRNLRRVVPSLRRQRDVDKVEVVTEAARYIDHLHKTLIERFVLCGIPSSLKDVLGTEDANELGSQHIMNLVTSMAAAQRQEEQRHQMALEQQRQRRNLSHPTPASQQQQQQRQLQTRLAAGQQRGRHHHHKLTTSCRFAQISAQQRRKSHSLRRLRLSKRSPPALLLASDRGHHQPRAPRQLAGARAQRSPTPTDHLKKLNLKRH